MKHRQTSSLIRLLTPDDFAHIETLTFDPLTLMLVQLH